MQISRLESLIRIKNWSKIVFIGTVSITLAAPDLVWKHFTHLLHVCYESLAFIMEEILIHGMGFNKHHAQMLVFYIFLFVLCGVLWRLWKRLPFLLALLKSHMMLLLLRARDYLMVTWTALNAEQKVQLLIVNLIGVWLGTTLLFL